ncbi:MAG TPA: gluconeogenesis factor YvcK family protein [Planctomycetota bacterium]|jgi:uncharacterized cofD-like protein
MTRIVTLGGGTGQAQALRGLARLGAEVTAVVGVTDNGGHSGHLRKEFGIPSVGDLRNCIAALADRRSAVGRALDFRFAAGDLEGASLGNLILAGLTLSEGSITRAASALAAQVGARARVLPVSNEPSQIAAALEDGSSVRGEWEIIRRSSRIPIAGLFHDPPIAATTEVLRALRRADLAVLGPGSLRTAIVSILLVTGVREALRKRRVAYVLNILTQAGQTDGFSAKDHVDEIAKYLGRAPDFVIANAERPPDWALGEAEFVDPSGIEARPGRLLEPVRRADAAGRARPSRYPAGPHLVRHDPAKLARAILAVADQ